MIDDATNEIVYRDYVDISVAVATPKGLVVPVLRDCNDMNFKQIDEEMDKLAQKARSGKLSVEDMDGGTFTIRFAQLIIKIVFTTTLANAITFALIKYL